MQAHNGGKTDYVDKNTFQYSIAGPLRKGDPLNSLDTANLLNNLGPILIETLENVIGNKCGLKLGNTSSIRFGGMPVAGHGQFKSLNHSFLYHGVIVIQGWDPKTIGRFLDITDPDSDKIAALPSIRLLAGNRNERDYKAEIAGNFAGLLSTMSNSVRISGDGREALLEEANKLCVSKYRNPDWTYKEDGVILRDDVRFCILFEDSPNKAVKGMLQGR